MKPVKQQDQSNLKWVADFIWNIADDRLRDVYVRGKYRDVTPSFKRWLTDMVFDSTYHPGAALPKVPSQVGAGL